MRAARGWGAAPAEAVDAVPAEAVEGEGAGRGAVADRRDEMV